MATADEFEEVRKNPDPIQRGLRAAELMVEYQQRAIELARLRKASIEEAHLSGLSYTEIAEKLGVTKGRISQIRSSAPRRERAFFGVGPVAVGIPRRFGREDGRERPFFDATDEAARSTVEETLTQLSLAITNFPIDPDQTRPPEGDCVIICGPKSAPVAQNLLEADPFLGFDHDDDGWSIVDSRTDEQHRSPYQDDNSSRTDIGYFSRRTDGERIIVHIAGITSVGSLGTARWLQDNLDQVFEPTSALIDGVVECDFDEDFTVTNSRLLVGPYTENT